MSLINIRYTTCQNVTEKTVELGQESVVYV